MRDLSALSKTVHTLFHSWIHWRLSFKWMKLWTRWASQRFNHVLIINSNLCQPLGITSTRTSLISNLNLGCLRRVLESEIPVTYLHCRKDSDAMVQFSKLRRWREAGGKGSCSPQGSYTHGGKDRYPYIALLFAQFINPYDAKQCFLVFSDQNITAFEWAGQNLRLLWWWNFPQSSSV